MAEEMTEFYQIYYDDKQLKTMYPFAIPYKNEGLTVFFENEVIKKLVTESKADKISVCSWKLKLKMPWYIGRPREITQELLESEYEVMSFTRNTENHRMLSAAALWHPGFIGTFDKILAAIGVRRSGDVKVPIYQNHFSAKATVYKDYVSSYLIPAMDAITNDKEINALAMADSKYSDLTHQSAVHLKEKLGISYYPLVPFLLERLFSVYVHNNKIRVTHL